MGESDTTRTEEKKIAPAPSRGKRILLLAVFFGLLILTTAFAKLLFGDAVTAVRIPVYLAVNLTNGALAFLFLRLNGMNAAVDFKNRRQYIVGVLLALALLAGVSVFGLFGIGVFSHREFVPWKAVYTFFNFLFVIGPVEELVFREYVQGTLLIVCGRGWLAVCLASLLFGLWHFVFTLNWFQLLLTTLIGAALGFARLRLKNGTYLAVSLGHGLYDELLDIVGYLI